MENNLEETPGEPVKGPHDVHEQPHKEVLNPGLLIENCNYAKSCLIEKINAMSEEDFVMFCLKIKDLQLLDDFVETVWANHRPDLRHDTKNIIQNL